MLNETPPPASVPPQPLSVADERTWAMLAHLSYLLNFVTGFLGVAAPLIIYVVYRDRSRYVAFQAMQAFVFQLITWVGAGMIIGFTWVITTVLSAVFIGLLCLPFACLISLLPLAAPVYSVIGGLECNQGKDFRYWLVGELVRDNLGQ